MSEEELININGIREDLYQAMQIGDITLSSKHSQELYDFMNYQDKEIEKLKNGLHKLLELNHYMMHCSSKRVIDELILKQWYLIYETLGEQTPGIAFASKGSDSNDKQK